MYDPLYRLTQSIKEKAGQQYPEYHNEFDGVQYTIPHLKTRLKQGECTAVSKCVPRSH